MSTEILEHSATKQELINQFNQAFALLNTNAEDVRLNARLSKTFKAIPDFQAEVTDDIALLHQYEVFAARDAAWADEALFVGGASETLVLHDARLFYAGAKICTLNHKSLIEKLWQTSLMAYQLFDESMLSSENALCVDGLYISEMTSDKGISVFAVALVHAAKQANVEFLVLSGASHHMAAIAKKMRDTAADALQICDIHVEGQALLAYRFRKMH